MCCKPIFSAILLIAFEVSAETAEGTAFRP